MPKRILSTSASYNRRQNTNLYSRFQITKRARILLNVSSESRFQCWWVWVRLRCRYASMNAWLQKIMQCTYEYEYVSAAVTPQWTRGYRKSCNAQGVIPIFAWVRTNGSTPCIRLSEKQFDHDQRLVARREANYVDRIHLYLYTHKPSRCTFCTAMLPTSAFKEILWRYLITCGKF